MLAIFELKPFRLAVTKNYVIEDYKNPSKKKIEGFRTKKIIDKDGYKHLIKFALLKGGGTVKTSFRHHKNEPKAKQLLRKWRKSKKKIKYIGSAKND